MSCRLPSKFGDITASNPSASDIERVQDYVSELSAFVASFEWLASIHAYDICLLDFYNTVWPEDWRELSHESIFHKDHLIQLAKEGTVQENWPKSLKVFVETCTNLRLPRDVNLAEFGGDWSGCEEPINRSHTAASGMSKKKLYEVERFSKLIIERLASSPYKDSTTVIDIGAGQGYLTHRLTTQHPCVAVDFDTIQTVGSTARGNDIRKGKFKDSRIDMKLKSKPQPRKPITYKTAHMNQDTLISLVKDLESDPECESKDFCLVGLHACGDLSATAMLTTFRDCESVKTIAVVPCCFNLLTTECETVHGSNQTHFGFPISKHIQSLSTIHSLSLPHTARNLACQNFDSFSAGTIESSLHNHYKRALLSALLAHYNLEAETQEPERGPSTFASGAEEGQPTAELCSSNIEKKYHKFRLNKLSPEALKGPFVPYAVEAVACLGLAGKLSREQIEEFATLERYKNAEREVFVVHCVRSLLARVVESLLLMDRYLFLSEMGKDIRFEMRNLFDIGESPRNMVFIAEKIK